MNKIRYIILFVLVAFIITARMNVSVGEWYATQVFPYVSAVLSLMVSWIPFSMTEVLVVSAVSLMIYVLITNIRHREKAWKILIKEAEIVAWIMVWLYFGWGMNYFRENIYSRGDFHRQAFDEVVFKQFMADYADSLNHSYTSETVDMSVYEKDIKERYFSVPEHYGLSTAKSWQHPKKLIFNHLYTAVGVGGYIGPFFGETHLNGDLFPQEQPSSYAHELSHLLGVSNEDEANFWAYQICRNSDVPAVRYSGYYSLLPYVLSNASRVLDEEEYKEYVFSIRPEVRQQLAEEQEFWRSRYSKTLGKIQSVIYDSMLKANKIPSGTKNYTQVIELIIAAEYQTEIQLDKYTYSEVPQHQQNAHDRRSDVPRHAL